MINCICIVEFAYLEREDVNRYSFPVIGELFRSVLDFLFHNSAVISWAVQSPQAVLSLPYAFATYSNDDDGAEERKIQYGFYSKLSRDFLTSRTASKRGCLTVLFLRRVLIHREESWARLRMVQCATRIYSLYEERCSSLLSLDMSPVFIHSSQSVISSRTAFTYHLGPAFVRTNNYSPFFRLEYK